MKNISKQLLIIFVLISAISVGFSFLIYHSTACLWNTCENFNDPVGMNYARTALVMFDFLSCVILLGYFNGKRSGLSTELIQIPALVSAVYLIATVGFGIYFLSLNKFNLAYVGVSITALLIALLMIGFVKLYGYKA